MIYSNDYFNDVLTSYIHCALWITFDDYEDLEIDEDSYLKAKKDVKQFLDAMPENNIHPSQIGHDLFLTRNRHGAGFWDRYLDEKEPKLRVIKKELGKKLTDIAQKLGEVDVYIGDNGLVSI